MRLKRCLSVKLAIAAGFLAAELRPESTHVAQLTTCQTGAGGEERGEKMMKWEGRNVEM